MRTTAGIAPSEESFRHLVEDHRRELHAHCYRMLGSLHDADDALQETLLRAWRGLPEFAGRSSLRTWLYKIATNACLNAIARRSRRILPIDYGPSTTPSVSAGEPPLESVWIEPYPDEALGLPDGYATPDARYEQREAVELAFIASLQHLPATQRAVLILRDVLGFSAREVAEDLDTTVVSVNSALQRARRKLEQRLPDRSQQKTLRSLGEDGTRKVVEAYLDAWARADVQALKALLAQDAVFSMPPWPIWWLGREAIAEFAETAADICPVTRQVATHASGQLAVASYSLDPAGGRGTATAIDVYTFEDGLIKEITAFVMPELSPHSASPRRSRCEKVPVMALTFGVTVLPDPPYQRLIDLLVLGERHGFEYGWTYDSHVLWQESTPTLALAAAATERIKLGHMVTNPGTREPTVVASMYATLHDISDGRMVMGIGRGDSARRYINQQPVRVGRFEDCVQMIKPFMNGEKVHWNDIDLELTWVRPELPPIEMHVAGYGPKVLAIAGRHGDGVIIQLADPDIIQWTMATARKAAEEAGRDPAALKCIVCAPSHISDDLDAAREQVRWFPAMVSNHVRDLIRRYGADGSIVPKALTDYVPNETHYDYDEHSRVGAKHGAFVTDEICDRFCVLGTPEQAATKLRELESIGVDQFNIYLMTEGQEETLETYGREIIPRLAGVIGGAT
jgi:probable F420-dependent oxidoreductase/RNA polymerase sigma-70 factor (TIGR02960 family)